MSNPDDAKVSTLPRITPPFIGSEVLYIIDANGVPSKVLLSDILGIGVRQTINAGGANIPAFAALANVGAGQMGLATNNGTLQQAQVVAIALAAIGTGQSGNVQFNGYISGLSGLTVGPVWLGTAGGLVSAPPLTQGLYQTRVGYAISATELILQPGFPELQ